MAKVPAFTAYNVKTKQKGVVIKDLTIVKSKTARGYTFMAKGNDGKGNSLSAIISEAKANEAVKAGAKKGKWDK